MQIFLASSDAIRPIFNVFFNSKTIQYNKWVLSTLIRIGHINSKSIQHDIR